jgi:RNA polymerase sigma factor (sigma-70 family)
MDLNEVAGWVRAAGAGDQRAWDAIVDRYAALVWSVARGFELGTGDAADVCQATWMRLVEHLADLRDPAALGAWLATTTRREALTLLRRRREVPVADMEPLGTAGDERSAPWHDLVARERDRELWQAFRQLPARCQELLRLLIIEPASYVDVAAALALPVGSLGPNRARCLAAMRKNLRGRTTGEGATI